MKDFEKMVDRALTYKPDKERKAATAEKKKSAEKQNDKKSK
jgi:hypothetical protein